jgi:hypothetical protein
MTDLVVVDHHLDETSDSYRLTIGYVRELAPVEDGAPPTAELVPVEDFLFAAGDEKWEGKTPEDIVREQKRLVRAALRKRDDTRPKPKITGLPGVGKAL